jgi:LysR family transcriptional regulator, glycine cleavage system transcriptional activator
MSAPPSRKSLPPFEALRAFDAVARLGGVRKAAQNLNRDHASVSRHLRAIETWTGATLIRRTASGIVLTEDGLRYHQQIAAALDSIALATLDLMRRGQNQRLQIRSIAGFALHWLSARIGDFEKSNPGLDIEVRPAERGAPFSSMECDVEIRLVPHYGSRQELGQELKSSAIARVPIVAVASPDYLARSGVVHKPVDLLQHQLLHEENFDRWGSWLASHGVYDDVYLTGPRLWQSQFTMDAARHGRGVALTNHLVATADLASGRLIEIGRDIPAFQPVATADYLLVARADRWDSTLIRRFREWLATSIARELPHLASPASSTPAA